MTAGQRQILIARLKQAFQEVVRGQGTSLREGRVLDDYGSEEEQAKARKLDTDHHRWEISDKSIEELTDAITFLDAEGFRFYLPAFLTYALRRGQESDWPVGDWAVGQLAWLDREGDFELMTQEQKLVVAQVLRFFAEHVEEDWADGETAIAAIRKYWHRFLQDSSG